MTKLLEQAIAKVQSLSTEEQDVLAVALLSMTDGDAADFPLDEETRAAIREGLAQAERGEFISDEQVAEVERRLAEPNPKTLTVDEFQARLRGLGA
jgi:hypothetical protein